MSTSAQSLKTIPIQPRFSFRMGRCLLDCLACYAAAH
ncbi:hypothetical protein CT19431_40187 [Cupriavidus taiwanensis]|nr:hypothetical protein CT19431_40187 [Cupriavidus taiwanensis]